MSFKIGLSSNPGKDRAKAEVAMKGDQNLKDALKEVLGLIGQCFENAQLIDKRLKEKAGSAALENEKQKAMEGNADIVALARALGFDVEDDDDDDDDDDDMVSDHAEEEADDSDSDIDADTDDDAEAEDDLDFGDLGAGGDDDEDVDLDFGDFDDD